MNISTVITEDLEIRTLRFTKSTVFLTEYIEDSIHNKEFIKRIVTSVSNIGVNYLHAKEACNEKEFLLKIKICNRDISETLYWLKLIRDTNSLWGNGHLKCLINECLELENIFKVLKAKPKAFLKAVH